MSTEAKLRWAYEFKEPETDEMEIQVSPKPGKWNHKYLGELELSDADYAEALKYFEKYSPDGVNLNYDHKEGPSAGKLTKLIHKAGKGLFGVVKFTAKAFEHIKKGEYRHISPELMFNFINKFTGEKNRLRVKEVAITNTPFFEGMQPLSAFGEPSGACVMYFAETVPNTDEAHARRDEEIKRQQLEKERHMKNLFEKLALKFDENAKPEEQEAAVIAKFAEMKKAVDEAMKQSAESKKALDTAMAGKSYTEKSLLAIQSELKEVKVKMFTESRDAMINKNIERGALTPAEVEKLKPLITAENLEKFSEAFAARPNNSQVPLGKGKGHANPPAGELDEDEKDEKLIAMSEVLLRDKKASSMAEAQEMVFSEHPELKPDISKR